MHSRALSALALLVLSSVAATAAPPPVPRGTELRVNTTPGSYKPRIDVFPDGGFVVVWTGSGARARFLDAQGRPASREIGLPGVTGIVDQVVADRDGSFLLVWTGVSATHPESNIYVRRFNRDGTPRGKRIRANLPSTSDRRDAVATIGADGRFAVAWKSEVPIPGTDDASYLNAVGRIFKADGTPLTSEILLRAGEPPTAAGDDTIHALPSSLALRPNGTLAVLLQDTGECYQTYLREVSPAGEPSATLQPLGSIFCGNPVLGGTTASLAMGKDGSLVAAWSDGDIQAQRLAPNGELRGDWFHVSSEPLNYQIDPAAAVQAGGTFVIVWSEEDRDGEGRGVFGRSFAANGTPRTQDFRVSVTTEGEQHDPAIAAARQGPVVVVWNQAHEDNERSGVFARVLLPRR